MQHEVHTWSSRSRQKPNFHSPPLGGKLTWTRNHLQSIVSLTGSRTTLYKNCLRGPAWTTWTTANTIFHVPPLTQNLQVHVFGDFLVFRIFTKDYCIQLAKPQPDANRPKSPPPPHFCLLVRYSTRIAAHDITLRTDISCIIEPHFGFCGRKAPPQDEGKFFDFRFIRFRQFWATLVFVAEKPPPPPRWGKFFWPQIYPFQAISSNFGFCGRKAPPPPKMRKFFLTADLSVLGNFEQLWFLWQKSPPPMREIFLTADLSISGNFEQLWFLWQKSPPPPDEGNFFDRRFICFRQFRATLVFVAEKPPPQDEGNFFDRRFIRFRQFRATLVFVAEKPPPPPPPKWGKFFWLQIYLFQAISSNFGFCGRKAPPPPMREIFLTADLSVSGNFEQLWFLWQKSPPPPRWGKFFLPQIYPFQAISSNFGFCGRKAPPPKMREIFWPQIYQF